MKKWAILTIILWSTVGFSQESSNKISCSAETRNINVQDTASTIRRNSGFETGTLILEIDATKSPTISKGYNQENDTVIYESTIIGTAVIKETQKSKYFGSSCTVKFKASECEILSILCTGV